MAGCTTWFLILNSNFLISLCLQQHISKLKSDKHCLHQYFVDDTDERKKTRQKTRGRRQTTRAPITKTVFLSVFFSWGRRVLWYKITQRKATKTISEIVFTNSCIIFVSVLSGKLYNLLQKTNLNSNYLLLKIGWLLTGKQKFFKVFFLLLTYYLQWKIG